MTINLAQLRELLAAATPRPWRVEDETYVLGPDEENVPRGYSPQQYVSDSYGAANARLIAAGINALPALLAVYEAAHEIWDRVRTRGFAAADERLTAALIIAVDAARKIELGLSEGSKREKAPPPIKHTVTPRFESGGYRGHCTCGWTSKWCEQLSDLASSAEIHLHQMHTVPHEDGLP